MRRDVPGQEEPRKWFRSHLLGREVELQELYDLSLSELDLLMAKRLRSDPIRKTAPAITDAGARPVTCSSWHASLMHGACMIDHEPNQRVTDQTDQGMHWW